MKRRWSPLMRMISTATAIAVALLFPVAGARAEPVSASASNPGQRWIGFYVPGAPADPAPLAALEEQVGRRAMVSHYFFGVPAEPFDASAMQNAAARGTTPLATMEFWDYRRGVDQPAYSLKRIAAGDFDEYLRTYAADAKAYGGTVWLRPLHEMNGFWYPWCGTVNGNSPSDFVAAWRHVRNVFREAAADNVKFVWCPSATSHPRTAENAIEKYWPGDSYVDLVALDGYNLGSPGRWQSFGALFGAGYASVTALTAKPLFIAEVGCSTVGGDKAAWIREMFATVPSRYPRVKGITWFNVLKERDWRVDSSEGSLSGFRSGALEWSRSHWRSSMTGPANLASMRGATITLGGTLRSTKTPVLARRQVSLHRRYGTRWRWVAGTTTSSRGTFAFRVRTRIRGTQTYQVRFGGAASSTNELMPVSKNFRITVR